MITYLASVASSILLNDISTNEIFAASPISEDAARRLTQAYYCMAALSACSQMAVIVIVLVAYLHYSLMVSSRDKIWFVGKWDALINIIPQIFIVIGCLSLTACFSLGSFIIGNETTGYIISLVCVLFFTSFLFIWATMVRKNFKCAEKTVLQYSQILNDAISSTE